MLNTLKGYIKRLTTPKPDKTYQPAKEIYNIYEWRIISLYKDNFGNSNIILELDTQISDKYTDIDFDISVLLKNMYLCGIRVLEYKFKDTSSILIAGSVEQYISVLTVKNTLLNADMNRVYRSFINKLRDIDIMHNKIDYVLGNEYLQKSYYPYETEITELTCTNPIIIQYIDTENLYSEILKTDYMELMIYLMVISIYGEKTCKSYYISDLANIISYDDTEIFSALKESMYANFNIPGFKNVFDINFKVTNDDESMYDDIDEVIE